MRIGIVSDTHGHLSGTIAAIHMLDSMQVEQVIHCGDIGSEEVVPLFRSWPTHFVFGNVDTDEIRLRKAIRAAGQHCHDRFGELELAGCKVAFLHGDDNPRLRAAVASGEYDLVCHGHTHVARQQQFGRTTLLNPGALYRANPHTLAVVDLPDLQILSVPV